MSPGHPGPDALRADNARLQEQVERLHERVKTLEGARAVAGEIAHDLNNLITVIAGYGDVVLRRLEPDDALRGPLEGLREAAERAAALVGQLLKAPRAGAPSTPVNVNEVVTATLPTLRRLAGAAIEVGSALDPAVGQVGVTSVQIERILSSLVVSVRDALPSGGRLVVRTANAEVADPARLRLRLLKAGRYVVLAIGDAFAGRPDRAPSPPSPRERGRSTGLGLSIAYDIVTRAGGDVRIQRSPSLSFEVYLPRHEALAAPPVPGTAAASASEDKDTGTPTILLVEDEAEVRELVRDVLELEGYAVVAARAGDDALDLAAELPGRIDLLITDIVMPGINGRDLSERLRATRPGLRTLFVSGYSGDLGDAHARQRPGQAFLPKPFAVEVLVETVRQLLGEPLTPRR